MARTILVAQVQVSSCFDEQLNTWQVPSGAHKVKPAARHSRRQHSDKDLSPQGNHCQCSKEELDIEGVRLQPIDLVNLRSPTGLSATRGWGRTFAYSRLQCLPARAHWC